MAIFGIEILKLGVNYLWKSMKNKGHKLWAKYQISSRGVKKSLGQTNKFQKSVFLAAYLLASDVGTIVYSCLATRIVGENCQRLLLL